MSEFRKTMKDVLKKSMVAIGNTASGIAQSTKFKVDEMNLVTRRHDIITDFGNKAYELWKNGETNFPEELTVLLKELAVIDDELDELRETIAAQNAAKKPIFDSLEPVVEDTDVKEEAEGNETLAEIAEETNE